MPCKSKSTRRDFLKQSAAAVSLAGWAAVGGGAGDVAAASRKANPYALDFQRLGKIDPALLQYKQVSRITDLPQRPRRIAIGTNDEVCIAGGKSILLLDLKGNLLTEIALTTPGRCVAVTPDSQIFVGLRDHVEIFDRKGQLRARWDSLPGRPWLTGIAVSDNDVYLADAGNRVVLRCYRSGKVVSRIGEKNPERNIPGFVVPSPFFDLEMHKDGLLRVTNPGRHRVEAYTADGDLEFFWGKASAAIDGFCGCCNPIHLALLPDGRFVTCEKGIRRVKVYHADGRLDCVVAGPDSFDNAAGEAANAQFPESSYGGIDAAVDSAGRIYIVDLARGDVRIMAHQGTVSEPETHRAESAG